MCFSLNDNNNLMAFMNFNTDTIFFGNDTINTQRDDDMWLLKIDSDNAKILENFEIIEIGEQDIGGLASGNGNLIGINSKIFSRTGAYQGIGFAIPSNLIVQIATQLIKFGEVRTLWIGNFRVLRVKINNNNSIINGLRIVEMQNTGPLFEKGIKVDDIIIGINEENANWNNLISSLKFATLGENLKLDLITRNGELISINFDSLSKNSN